jgi:diguanylate cyclase (GGDEF)-like protein
VAPRRSYHELQLVQALHGTLELEALVTLFGSELRSEIPHDGLRYRHPERALECGSGKIVANICSYRLQMAGEFLGDLQLSRRSRFSEAELALIETRLVSLLSPLRNALKYQAAIAACSLDFLTGAYNRRALETTLPREVELGHRHGLPLSLVMLDVDHFKAVNTHYGHMAGDQVLEGIVRCIKASVRSSDLLFRYGGEEFALLLSNTDGAGALRVAEKIRAAAASLVQATDGGEVAVTLSLGVTALRPTDTPGAMIARADRALRDAKRRGRNRVARAPVEEPVAQAR